MQPTVEPVETRTPDYALPDHKNAIAPRVSAGLLARHKTEWELEATAWGQEIDYATMSLRADVKAVTYHLFVLEQTPDGWKSRIVLDI